MKPFYEFQRKSVKAWSWTRMKKVTQFYWICVITVFGKPEPVALSSELVHNKEDRNEQLDNLIEGIRQGRYSVKDVD